MNIILFRGESKYEALHFFIDCLKKSLQKNKHNVHVVDRRDGWGEVLNDILSKSRIDMMIDFNGICSDIEIENRSAYDVLNIYYLAIYVDHPSYHAKRLSVPNTHYLASFVDRGHVEFLQKAMPNGQKIKFFLPHAGKNVCRINNIKEYKNTKTIDILFTGSAPSKIEKPWKESSSKILAQAIDDIAIMMSEDMDMSLDEILDKVKLRYNILLSSIGQSQYAQYLHFPITYLRNIRRTLLIESLCDSGLNITVCGSGWDEFAKKYKNITYVGAVGMEESLELISKSKILAHNNADFSRGSHERVFNAMLNNTFVFSDRSEYYDEFFKEGEDIAYYKFSNIDKDIENLHTLLADDEKLYQMTKRPKLICEKYHTWDNRAEIIEDIYEYLRLLDN